MLTDFGDKPLVVLTAGDETDATHDAAQNKLATLSTDSRTASWGAPAMQGLSPTSSTPRPPPGPSSTSFHRSGTTNHRRSDLERGKWVDTAPTNIRRCRESALDWVAYLARGEEWDRTVRTCQSLRHHQCSGGEV